VKNPSPSKHQDEITKQTHDPIAARQDQLPAFMRGQAGMGTERIGTADIEIPRLKLLQALSPEVQEADHKQGHFFHAVAERTIGNEVGIVIVYVDQAFILWRPRKAGGGILARAADGVHWNPPSATFDIQLDNGKKVTWRTAPTVMKSGLAEWGSLDPSDPQSQPAATRMYNLVVVMPEIPELSPVVVTLQRAGIRVARKLMAKLKIAQAPSFGLKFAMSSTRDQGPLGDFWNFRFTSDGFVQESEKFDQYKGLYERFKAEGVRIRDIEKLQDEEMPGSTANGEQEKF
jgi:hypothetical protein